MNHNVIHYDRERLLCLLEDSLPEPLAGEVAEHLVHCEECRSQLESLAAAPQWWKQACSGVKKILDDPVSYQSSGGDELPISGESVFALSDESFASDFAVDFLEPSDDPTMLGRLGDYEILEVIGRGGMGIVFKSFQKELHRCVAVKVLAPHLALSAAARRRFEREAQATAAVVHPHVMAIHSVAANARLPYLVMPFVDCESLQQRLDRQGPLDVKDVLRIGMQAANGLAAAHAQGLVHRDVKPANILLETNVDRVMLTDFGLARAVDDATLTRTGIIAGTPQYMSPEQANGDAIDHRSDLFSLGSVLYAMCTARPPFRAETTFGVLRRIREESPRPIREINADIPEWLERIVMKLLAKSPDDRIATAMDVANLFEQCLAHVQQPTTVMLPVEISNWTVPSIPRAMSAETPRHVAQARWRWLLLGFVLVSSVAIIAFQLGSQRKQIETSEPPDNSGSQKQIELPVVSAARTQGEVPEDRPVLIGPLQWDGIQDGIDSAALVLERLEAQARRDFEVQDSNGEDSALGSDEESGQVNESNSNGPKGQ